MNKKDESTIKRKDVLDAIDQTLPLVKRLGDDVEPWWILRRLVVGLSDRRKQKESDVAFGFLSKCNRN